MQKANGKRGARLPFIVKFGYAGADGTTTAVFTVFYLFFLYFLTDVVKMSPAVAGFVIMVGTIWDAITDPAMGMLSDGIKTRWGRRRPFIIGMAVPFGIAFWLLFTDPNPGGSWTVAYFLFAILLFKTAWTVLYVPFMSLSAEVTQDYDERTSLMTYRSLWSQVFAIFGAAIPLVLAKYFAELCGSQRMGWSWMGATFGFFGIFPILLTWRVTRGYELFPQETSIKLKDSRDALFNNRPFRYVLGIWFFGQISITAVGVICIYFMTYYLGFDEDKSSMAFLFLFVCTVIWIPFISMTTKKLGKRLSWILFVGLWGVVMSVGMMFVKPGGVIFFYILLFLASGGVTGGYLIGWSVMADIVEVDEFKRGQRREGTYMGIMDFAQKIGCALSIWIVGLILSFAGYVPEVEQTQRTLMAIRLLFAEGTGLLIFSSVVFAYLNPMTKVKHDALRQAIADKKEGKPYDTSGLEDILL